MDPVPKKPSNILWNGRRRFIAAACLLAGALYLSACESENEHFCAKYSYYYRELTQPGLMPYRDIERQLMDDLNNPAKDPDRSRIALFVLTDIVNEAKPKAEDAQAFCMRRQLWERYH